ncbi:hypothetical protein HG263_15515 [Pseudoalteromonas sp. JBTF-M23]|uniref:Uncharacterized protein n=1 Tax=Pseudoalteromonas caenipelagi TaxID=2726988 RepID=A0A849VGM1_9GAMM|nr:hypothetical protein [Pseudoalteromonas caenipelagi]NOU51940.1 hypothetical protein [Pseudoalteromonas caenipelagi]
MDQACPNTIISLLEDAGRKGSSGANLRRSLEMTDTEFKQESKKLWDKGSLCGIREENCCTRGCGFMCTAYLDESKIWKLTEND